jgi:putative ABC transport system permease protein
MTDTAARTTSLPGHIPVRHDRSLSMTALVAANIWAKKARSAGIAAAVALAVMTVVTLTVVSSGLETAASALLTVGKADFTVAQNGVSDLLYSNIDTNQLAQIAATPGVRTSVGVLLETERIDAANPLFIEIGIQPQDLATFGVTIVAGTAYGATAPNEVMLGWRAAQNLGLHVGDEFQANGTKNRIVGIFSTGISYGDSAAMFPLPALQAYNRVPGSVSLVFVKIDPGYRSATVQRTLTRNQPELTTIATLDQAGRADRNLVFLKAAVTGSTILALVIGAIVVGNTMLLSLFERTREFGLQRAVGWGRRRVVWLVVSESMVLALVGSILGVALSFIATTILEALPQLHGVLHAEFTPGAFWRGFAVGIGMAILGSLYPSVRAANLTPLKALSSE